MNTTFRDFGNSILTVLKQKYDDSKVTMPQVLHWTSMVANRIIYQDVKKSLTNRYLNIYEATILADAKGRKYIELPALIVDIDNDNGIAFINYCDVSQCDDALPIQRVQAQEVKSGILSYSPYTKASLENAYFYRVGNKIFFKGLECVDVGCVEIGLRTLIDGASVCELDKELPFEMQLESVLYYEVLNLCKFAILVGEERYNDGSSTGNQMRATDALQKPKATNYNIASQLTNEEQQ